MRERTLFTVDVWGIMIATIGATRVRSTYYVDNSFIVVSPQAEQTSVVFVRFL